MISLVIEYQPHRTLAHLRGKLVRRFAHHGSILLGSWSLRQTRGGSKGEVRTAELAAIGIPRCYLSRMCEEGLIVRVAYGRYRLAVPKAA
ncbi:type IV toxin-antitoxin system AbiEi family antitoxin domain-containing protein [Mesorhizobium sp. PUT5]|uniref:type IV toxin-antitoxin system AbiEi family antitoxin domain-containing protein n=1 Tax=Mesorhizobium sp. PUT5 TaxID=3454629 RepID=UPI003FA4B4FB